MSGPARPARNLGGPGLPSPTRPDRPQSLRRPPPVVPRGTLLSIMLGVLAYLGLLQLPPDSSLAQVRETGVLNVCVPLDLTPYLTGDPEAGTPGGSEAALVQRVAHRIGVPVGWSLQTGWAVRPTRSTGCCVLNPATCWRAASWSETRPAH